MRLGGPILAGFTGPDDWVRQHQQRGYRAAYCPVKADAPEDEIDAYVKAAAEADLCVAEVGSWCNLIGPDEIERQQNIARTIANLELAEKIGARCCVDIAGSMNPDQWNGPHPEAFSSATFDRIVETVREIIDAVKPRRSAFALEMMSWGLPDSAETYLELIQAIEREAFAVHFDPVNLIHSPRRYASTGTIIAECIRLLGPFIRSVHLKDVVLHGNHLVHLDECAPGSGNLDYQTLLRELDRLDDDLPVMMEHLRSEEAYAGAAGFIRSVARDIGVSL